MLLIEAGKKTRNPLSYIPMGVGAIWNNPRYNWSYRSEPEPALGGRRLYLPRGKVLGGSSVINAMNYVRGNPADFDAWAALGLPEWAHDNILPYFRRVERYHGDDPDGLRGDTGPLAITEANHPDPIVDALFEALAGQGYSSLSDYNGASQEGFGRAQFNIDRGKRQSSETSFLNRARRRPNLSVKTGAMVDRITFSADRRANGVTFRRHGRICAARAEREVVLAAGAYASPTILMRSGIGPGSHLSECGLETFADLPGVGRNLWDHPRIAVEYRRRTASYVAETLYYHRLITALIRCQLTGSGKASLPLAAAHLFSRSEPERTFPDIQYLFRLFNPALKPIYPWQAHSKPDTFGAVVCLVQPTSRGEVRLNGASLDAPPRIETRIADTEEDITALIRAARSISKVAGHPALSPHIAEQVLPGAECVSDASWRMFIRETADTIFHPAGTCAMDGSGKGVVDGELCVRTVQGLSVADASVMPLPVTGNIQAAVFMVAEKASDMILKRAACGR